MMERVIERTLAVLSAPRFAWTLSVTIIMTALGTTVIVNLIEWPGLIAITATLCLLSGATLFARREQLEWQGLLPISLLAFLTWSALSIIWSQYQWQTAGALAYQWAFALLGVTVALTRDSIQIVRAFGDCLRVVIGASLALEVFAGLIIDGPIRVLGIEGNLYAGGPIQGIVGSRNQMGLVALLALITFAVELRTRSVTRLVGICSLAAAGLTVIFTQSPAVIAVAFVVAAATGAIALLRRVPTDRRTVLQWVLAAGTVIAIVVAYLARSQLIDRLNAASESEYRIDLWRQLWRLIALHPLEGWGWIGAWNTSIPPFSVLESAGGVQHRSALNGLLDVWFQLGAIGTFLFVVLVGLTFVRAWILASRNQTSTIVWGALVMVALITVSFAESDLLTDIGWFTLVLCSVRAAQQLSWRRRFASREQSAS